MDKNLASEIFVKWKEPLSMHINLDAYSLVNGFSCFEIKYKNQILKLTADEIFAILEKLKESLDLDKP